jgi:adenylate cyclase
VPGRGGEILDEDVRAQLERILASEDFSHSARLQSFLRYVVEETLAGHGDRIKAYAVATEAFGRAPAFDAQNDPIVRIEASRLRRALERYYLLIGTDDPIVVDVPKGHYKPTFTARVPNGAIAPANGSEVLLVERPSPASQPEILAPAPRRKGLALAGAALIPVLLAGYIGVHWLSSHSPSPSAPAGDAASRSPSPLAVVLPFSDLGDAPTSTLYATGLTEELVSQLARFSGIAVLGRDTANTLGPRVDLGRLRREVGVRFAIEGSVRASGSILRVAARLVDTGTGAVLWSHTYDEDPGKRDVLAIQRDVAEQVATKIAQPYGAIFRADQRRSSEDPEAYACTAQYYAYRVARSPEGHAQARDCMERTVQRLPAYGTGLAFLSVLYLDEFRFGFNPTPGGPPPLERSLRAAKNAALLDPEDTRALTALMQSLYFTGDKAEALRTGERALALSPNDTELLGELGTRVGLAGDWKRGAGLVERARALNPANAGFYNGSLAFAAYMQREYHVAARLIRLSGAPQYPFYHLVAAVIYAQLGLQSEAEAERAAFEKQRPDFVANWRMEWERRLGRAEDRTHLDEGARRAGFKMP